MKSVMRIKYPVKVTNLSLVESDEKCFLHLFEEEEKIGAKGHNSLLPRQKVDYPEGELFLDPGLHTRPQGDPGPKVLGQPHCGLPAYLGLVARPILGVWPTTGFGVRPVPDPTCTPGHPTPVLSCPATLAPEDGSVISTGSPRLKHLCTRRTLLKNPEIHLSNMSAGPESFQNSRNPDPPSTDIFLQPPVRTRALVLALPEQQARQVKVHKEKHGE